MRNVHCRPPEAAAAEVDELRQVGLSMRKAEYIKGIGKARFFVRTSLNSSSLNLITFWSVTVSYISKTPGFSAMFKQNFHQISCIFGESLVPSNFGQAQDIRESLFQVNPLHIFDLNFF